MKEIYLIEVTDLKGYDATMKDAYTTFEYAMEAKNKYQEKAKLEGKKWLYYISSVTVIK